MGLFSQSQLDEINAVAAKSKAALAPAPKVKPSKLNNALATSSDKVLKYFKDSPAILINNAEMLHNYVDDMIRVGEGGVDTETTGLDRIKDWIVGSSLYYPGGVEAYIPNKHLVPIFDEPYRNQLSYEDMHKAFSRVVEHKTKLIFANADFDLSMIAKDYAVDLSPICYYDVILAWRCIKENEPNNKLKTLYHKYVLKGQGEAMQFTDFFDPALFPYCKPEIAKLYAANDAKITYDLYKWQLPFITLSHPKCTKHHLESIASLVWDVEFPLIPVCLALHQRGVYLDTDIAARLSIKYHKMLDDEKEKLAFMVQNHLVDADYVTASKSPFKRGTQFNANSSTHVRYLFKNILKLDVGDKFDKNVLAELNVPVAKQILKVRNGVKLLSTYVDKLPQITGKDRKVHASFKSIGADTGRFSSENPNMQNIPSHAGDIRHMFRATPGYVMLSSDYSQQEPKLTAFVSQDEKMIKAFKDGKDIYATIASLAFELPYEDCCENHPVTGDYQPEGKARRGEAKTIVLGITYGRSVVTIAEQLFGDNDKMTDDQKIQGAQKIYDSVLNAFPNLRKLMLNAQATARQKGYVETILGRRRHIPDMQLKEFEFIPLKGYVNSDVDPLDVTTLVNRDAIPQRIVDQLEKEFKSYRHFGQIAKRTKELNEHHIRVINNRSKINDASRKCVNSIIQGSAAEQTKLAMLLIENNKEWQDIGGRVIIPVHDELIAEVPAEHWKRGGEILSELMCEAANFLPFASKCDVVTTYRWYGLQYPCPYTRPTSLKDMTEDEIKWVQYMLVELEYTLPIFKEPDGSKPRGDAASGVNGKLSDEFWSQVSAYKAKHHLITDEDFIDTIFRHVDTGSTLKQGE